MCVLLVIMYGTMQWAWAIGNDISMEAAGFAATVFTGCVAALKFYAETGLKYPDKEN